METAADGEELRELEKPPFSLGIVNGNHKELQCPKCVRKFARTHYLATHMLKIHEVILCCKCHHYFEKTAVHSCTSEKKQG